MIIYFNLLSNHNNTLLQSACGYEKVCLSQLEFYLLCYPLWLTTNDGFKKNCVFSINKLQVLEVNLGPTTL